MSKFFRMPDNLVSDDYLEIVLGLGQGEFTGLYNGFQSLYFGETAFENADGTPNFPNFDVTLLPGDPIGTPINLEQSGAGFSPVTVGVELAENAWVTRQINDLGVDYIDIRITISALYRQTSEGVIDDELDLEFKLVPLDGPLAGTAINPADYTGVNQFSVLSNSARDAEGRIFYVNATRIDQSTGLFLAGDGTGTVRIKGKTQTTYTKELRVHVPSDGDYTNTRWSVSIRQINPPLVQTNDEEIRRSATLESLQGLASKVYQWTNLASLHIVGKSSDQLNTVPDIWGEYIPQKIKVPNSAVYDPSTQTYTGGLWDGTYELASVEDPAWIIKAVVEDDVAGLSSYIPMSLNKWDALESSKWFCGKVSDGKGGTECRYTLNLSIDEPRSGKELLNFLAGSVSAVAWDDGNGEIRLKVDKFEEPVAIFNAENIIGDFAYSHTDVTTRLNDIVMTFSNPDLLYKEDRVHVYDSTAINTYGLVHDSLKAEGCNSRQEVLRRAYHRLLTSQTETKIVTFNTNRQAALVNLWNVILIADRTVASGEHGRIVSTNGLEIQLRDPIFLENGINYEISFSVPNPDYNLVATSEPNLSTFDTPTKIITRTITNTAGAQRGSVTTLYIDTALPVDLPSFAPFSLADITNGVAPVAFRIFSITPTEDDPDQYTIVAHEVNRLKYDLVDNVQETQFQAEVLDVTVQPPAYINVTEQLDNNKVVLALSWPRSVSRWAYAYEIEYQIFGSTWESLKPSSLARYAEIQKAEAPSYNFRIRSLSRRGQKSTWREYTYVLSVEALRLVTASNSISGDPNENPDFEQGDTGWDYGDGCYIGKVPTLTVNGKWAGIFDPASEVFDVSFDERQFLNQAEISVSEGEKLHVKGRCVGEQGADGEVFLRVLFYDGSNTILSQTDTVPVPVAAGRLDLATTNLDPIVVPAGATHYRYAFIRRFGTVGRVGCDAAISWQNLTEERLNALQLHNGPVDPFAQVNKPLFALQPGYDQDGLANSTLVSVVGIAFNTTTQILEQTHDNTRTWIPCSGLLHQLRAGVLETATGASVADGVYPVAFDTSQTAKFVMSGTEPDRDLALVRIQGDTFKYWDAGTPAWTAIPLGDLFVIGTVTVSAGALVSADYFATGVRLENYGEIAPTRLVFSGVYNAATVYSFGQVVTYADGSYKYIGEAASSGNDPTNTTYWEMLANGSTWLEGSTIPANSLGVIGDYYIDNVTNDVYQKTDAITWTLVTNLTGGYKDYIYIRAASAPVTPTGMSPIGWSDGQPTEDGNPVYESWAWKAYNGNLIGAWSTPTLVNRPGFERQYSVDQIAWHSTVANGDIYFRERASGATIWGASVRFKGETGLDGGFIDYRYVRNATQPATPTGNTPTGWFDTPPTADGNPLWVIKALKTAAGVLTQAWSTPVELGGQGLDVQYGADNSTWHDPPFVSTDLYMRTRVSGGTTWSTGVRIVGEDGFTKIAISMNEKPLNGGYDGAFLRIYGYDALTGRYPDKTRPASIVKPDGTVFSWGGNTGNGQSGAYSGVNSNGLYYLVVDTSGGRAFTHTLIGNSNVGVCFLNGTQWQYFSAGVGWTNFTDNSKFVAFGWCERRQNAFINVSYFAPCFLSSVPEVYGLVGTDDPSFLPIESIAGVYILDPSSPVTAYDAGANVTISVASTTVYFGSSTISYTGSTTAIPSMSYNTRYWVYAVDPKFSGGAVTYQAATSRTGIPAHAVYFGSILTPLSGGTTSTATQGGAGSGGTYDPNYNIP